MHDQFFRTGLLLGQENIKNLSEARVAVFGVGGVGGYTVEALARSGIGTLDLIDNDKVSLTNLNRQIHALHSTLDCYKVDVARDRVLDINPGARVHVYKTFYLPETRDQFDFSRYDYVVDAIDTVTGKISLVEQAREAGVRIISSMGAGNKLDPTAFELADIYSTSVCPLARVMRRELKKRGIDHLKVVYSKEKPMTPMWDWPESASGSGPGTEAGFSSAGWETGSRKRTLPGSTAFVPAVAGLIIAGEVVKDLAAAVL